jgi:cyclophilin family peptidyl-prolyl cis-trans isomerase
VQKSANRWQKNEALEVATALSRLIPNTENEKAIKFLNELYLWGQYHDAETTIAWAKIAPKSFLETGGLRHVIDPHATVYDWQYASSQAQGLGELAASEDKDIKAQARKKLDGVFEFTRTDGHLSYIAVPDQLRALAAFKPENLGETLREYVKHDDLFVRATAADLLSELPASKQNVEALKNAFDRALLMDKDFDDAQLGILDALFKLDKKEAVGTLLIATSAQDYLVRKKAIDLLDDKDLQKDFPGIPTSLENARAKGRDRPQPYLSAFGTKLGSILNTTADYTRAVSRKNGSVKAVFTTDKGVFTIDLLPEDAPLTVDNFIKLARVRYFDGLMVHRVVPNFVMQDGDPRGDGNGGPGWSIRCEVNMVQYDRGAVGMALSGKDTGGSQWFVTHSPAPLLDGGYTVFGHVNENDMKVVDNIARGDKIISVKIIEGKLPQKGAKGPKK